MLLMEEAERIAREEHGSGKMAVISGDWRDGFLTHLFTLRFDLLPLHDYCVQIDPG
jgi:hypothetical protein